MRLGDRGVARTEDLCEGVPGHAERARITEHPVRRGLYGGDGWAHGFGGGKVDLWVGHDWAFPLPAHKNVCDPGPWTGKRKDTTVSHHATGNGRAQSGQVTKRRFARFRSRTSWIVLLI